MAQTRRSLGLVGERLAELTMLTCLNDNLDAQVTETNNRILGLLIQIHPAFECVLGPRLDHQAALDILEPRPSAAALATISE
ncbi:transposase [Burkholderia lata]|nr:transposase [Burkholderia lata]